MKLVRSKGTGAISFNFTPMIDVVFNLLIFFVLTAQFMTLEIEDVILAPSLTGESRDYAEFRNVVINITNPDNPTIIVMGHPITYLELTDHLKNLRQSAANDGKKMNVILRADRKIPYGKVALAMLAAGGAEIEGMWLQVDISKVEKENLQAVR